MDNSGPWKHPPRKPNAFMHEHGLALIIAAGAAALSTLTLVAIERAVSQAAFDAVNHQTFKG